MWPGILIVSGLTLIVMGVRRIGRIVPSNDLKMTDERRAMLIRVERQQQQRMGDQTI